MQNGLATMGTNIKSSNVLSLTNARDVCKVYYLFPAKALFTREMNKNLKSIQVYSLNQVLQGSLKVDNKGFLGSKMATVLIGKYSVVGFTCGAFQKSRFYL